MRVRDMPINNPHVKKIFSECGIEKHCTVEGLWDLAKLEDKQTALASTRLILPKMCFFGICIFELFFGKDKNYIISTF